MRTIICFASVVFLALACLIKGAGPARAACIYNRADHPIHVNLRCGPRCHNNWTIHIRDHKCQAGKGGKVWVRVMDLFNEHEMNDHDCEVEVDDHGWVTVKQDGREITVKSMYQDGSAREECTSTIVRY